MAILWCSGLSSCRSLRWQWKRTSTVLRPLHPQCTERPLAEDPHIHQGPLLSYPGSICGGSGNAVNSHSCCRHETTYDEMQLLTIQLTLAGQLHASSALLRAWWWKLQAHLRCVTPQVNLPSQVGLRLFQAMGIFSIPMAASTQFSSCMFFNMLAVLVSLATKALHQLHLQLWSFKWQRCTLECSAQVVQQRLLQVGRLGGHLQVWVARH